MDSMRKVAITGASGFIGSHLTEKLVKQGIQVTAIDDLSYTGINNIEYLIKEKNLQFIQGNIGDLSLLQKCFSGAEYVFHQAAIPYISNDANNQRSYYETNSNGILNVLQAAKDNGVKKVVFASSSAIYGNDLAIPKRENMLPDPQSPYAISKLINEHYCLAFTALQGLPTVCLRYFNVYGPRQRPDSQLASVIPKFIQKIKAGKPPIIFGNGEQTRDFVYIRDIVSANILAAESNLTGIFNIGSGEETSLNTLTRIILKLMNRGDLLPVYEKEKEGEIKYSLADISKARSFGYTPDYSLEEGLTMTIENNF